MIDMRLRKLFAVLMLSVFCLSGCSNQLKEVSEMEKEIEQTTTTAAVVDKKIGELVQVSDSEPDMSEKWEVVYGGEDANNGVKSDHYAFINESGYQFACGVYLPETAKNGMSCPFVLMNNGVWVGMGTDEEDGFSMVMGWASSYPREVMLATALNEEGIGLVVIEPFGSTSVYGTLLGAAEVKGESMADVPYAKGNENNNSFAVDKAYTEILLDHLGEISGLDPDRIILASRGYHNITVTQNAIMNQDKIKGFLMIDPCMDYQTAVRSCSLKPDEETIGYIASGYTGELNKMNLKTEAGKLNVDTKIFFSKDAEKDYDSFAEEGAPALPEYAKNFYPNSAPEILDTTEFFWEYEPDDKMTHSIKSIVSYCNNIFEK